MVVGGVPDGPTAILKSLHDEIGTRHRWRGLVRAVLAETRDDPRVRWLAIVVDDAVAGLVEVEAQPERQVEITIFGPTAPIPGSRTRRHLADPRRAFGMGSLRRRRTCGPSAGVVAYLNPRRPPGTPNYLRHGFVVFATETVREPRPDGRVCTSLSSLPKHHAGHRRGGIAEHPVNPAQDKQLAASAPVD